METIGYNGSEEGEMYCLLCVEEGLSLDKSNPITDDAYPDGFICDECYGVVSNDGSVVDRIG